MSLLVKAVAADRTVAVAVPTMPEALRMAAGMMEMTSGPWVVTVTDRKSGDVLGLIDAEAITYL